MCFLVTSNLSSSFTSLFWTISNYHSWKQEADSEAIYWLSRKDTFGNIKSEGYSHLALFNHSSLCNNDSKVYLTILLIIMRFLLLISL